MSISILGRLKNHIYHILIFTLIFTTCMSLDRLQLEVSHFLFLSMFVPTTYLRREKESLKLRFLLRQTLVESDFSLNIFVGWGLCCEYFKVVSGIK